MARYIPPKKGLCESGKTGPIFPCLCRISHKQCRPHHPDRLQGCVMRVCVCVCVFVMRVCVFVMRVCVCVCDEGVCVGVFVMRVCDEGEKGVCVFV